MRLRIISMFCTVCIVLSSSAFAIESDSLSQYTNNSIDPQTLEMYDTYTINLEVNSDIYYSEYASKEAVCENIDKAINFVKDLNLEEKGFEYIEEACLTELEDYKDCGVTLKQYTVLTPKNGLANFGVLNGNQYYWTDTSISVGTKSWLKNCSETGMSSKDWINMVGSLLFVFASHEALIPISAGLSMAGITKPADLYDTDQFRMSVNFSNVYQRGIGRYNDLGEFRFLYYDQRGSATYDIDFLPGKPSEYGNDIDIDFYEQHTVVPVKTYEYDNSRQSIMQVCQTLYNRPNSGYVKYCLIYEACNMIYKATGV